MAHACAKLNRRKHWPAALRNDIGVVLNRSAGHRHILFRQRRETTIRLRFPFLGKCARARGVVRGIARLIPTIPSIIVIIKIATLLRLSPKHARCYHEGRRYKRSYRSLFHDFISPDVHSVQLPTGGKAKASLPSSIRISAIMA